jgi:hypothetical protein
MRGIGVCARCGAKLQWSGPRGKKNFLPPRAGETTVFQRFWRTLRRLIDYPSAMEHLGRRLAASRIFHIWHKVPRTVLIATFLSLVPGLGHFYQKRILAGLGFAAAWTTLFCLLLTSYPWSPSFWPLTFLIPFLASSTHILSMVSASRPRDFRCGRREVLALLLPLAAIVYATYFYLAYTIEFPLARLPTLTEEELPDIFQYPDATLLGRAEYIIHGRDGQWPEPITAFGGAD